MNTQSDSNRKVAPFMRSIYVPVLFITAFGLLQAYLMYGVDVAYVWVLFLYFILFVMFATQLTTLISGRPASRVTKVTVNILSTFFMIAGLWVLLGLVADFSGASCVGFSGVSESCASQQLFIISFLALHPLVIVPVSILGILGLWWGRRASRQADNAQHAGDGTIK